MSVKYKLFVKFKVWLGLTNPNQILWTNPAPIQFQYRITFTGDEVDAEVKVGKRYGWKPMSTC